MIDVFVDEGMVFVGVPRLFTRPLRLTAPEGFSLLASARTAMELPGADPDGPLARGLAKLADALGQAGLDADVDRTAGVVVDLERPGGDRRADRRGGRRCGAAPSSTTRRPVARCRSARSFPDTSSPAPGTGTSSPTTTDRVSGGRSASTASSRSTRTGATHPLDPDATAPESFFADADLPRARLRLAPAAQWIIDRYPVDSVEPVVGRGGRARDAVDVVLPVASQWWLDRLLVRLGPDAEVREPRDGGDGARRLATVMLANYG